jgi:hypothetical protein
VMGAYGHSRTRELLLGGATRSLLRSGTRSPSSQPCQLLTSDLAQSLCRRRWARFQGKRAAAEVESAFPRDIVALTRPGVRIHLPPAKSLRTIGSSFGGRPSHWRTRRNLNKENGKGEEALVTLCEPC